MNKDQTHLTPKQILMIQLSGDAIESGRLITQKQLDKEAEEWLTTIQKEELDKRLTELENGIGRTYTWNETLAMTKQALVDRKTKGLKNNS
ncbi:MAG: addiction module protein [Chitinophagaceae bacterium]